MYTTVPAADLFTIPPKRGGTRVKFNDDVAPRRIFGLRSYAFARKNEIFKKRNPLPLRTFCTWGISIVPRDTSILNSRTNGSQSGLLFSYACTKIRSVRTRRARRTRTSFIISSRSFYGRLYPPAAAVPGHSATEVAELEYQSRRTEDRHFFQSAILVGYLYSSFLLLVMRRVSFSDIDLKENLFSR